VTRKSWGAAHGNDTRNVVYNNFNLGECIHRSEPLCVVNPEQCNDISHAQVHSPTEETSHQSRESAEEQAYPHPAHERASKKPAHEWVSPRPAQERVSHKPALEQVVLPAQEWEIQHIVTEQRQTPPLTERGAPAPRTNQPVSSTYDELDDLKRPVPPSTNKNIARRRGHDAPA
jgi:hypothetical protein